MRPWPLLIAPLVLASCAIRPISMTTTTTTGARAGTAAPTAATSGGDFERAQPAPMGSITVPDVVGMPPDSAVAVLEGVGYQGEVTRELGSCRSLDPSVRRFERGIVCYQFPPPGRVQGERLPILIRVESGEPADGEAAQAAR